MELLEALEQQKRYMGERRRRVQARAGLADYIAYVSPEAAFPSHQRRIIEALERVRKGQTKRLIINCPPRHGKSYVVSQHFPAQYISTTPKKKIIHSSHTLSLVEDFGQDIRDLLASWENQLLFPGVQLNQNSKAKKRFRSTNGCEYFAAGTGGSIIGRGAHIWLIEDPDDPDDCDNAEALAKNWEWFKKHYPRLEPDAAIVLIQQRVSENDLTGMILKNPVPGETWEHLNMPAIDEQGMALWPERWPLERLMVIRGVVGSHYFNAMFQQQPDAVGGTIVKRTWFRYWKTLPVFTRMVISCDLAFKEGQDTSFVAMHVYGIHGNDYYLVDRVHERMNYPDTRRAFMRLCTRWPQARQKIIEDKANGPALEADLRKTISGIVLIPKNKDKVECLHAATPPLESGHVYFPDPIVYPWAQEVIDEMVNFPRAKHDDDVDTYSQFIAFVEPVALDYLKNLGKM